MKQVKNIIAQKTGLDPEEIVEDACFHDDLNISEMELIDILTELEDELQVELLSQKDDIVSVGDLLDILSEKLE